ncbi:MAG: 16S rRNA (guanine(527)-N(7))-methyltransferase RsmG [Dehalococcoidia bacterium]
MDALIAGARTLGLELTPAQVERYRRYLAVLTAWNARVNLTSPAALADAERIHFLDSLTLAPHVLQAFPGGGSPSLIDVGSGAGFPGLALHIALPDLRVTLLEATGKKAEFLRAVCAELGLTGVDVVTARAEEAAHDPALREQFDVVTARALGPLATVCELTLPFCRVGGLLIASRGADAESEASRCEGALESLGGRLRAVAGVDVPGLSGQRALVLVDKLNETPARFPRRSGMPAKRPLV